MDLYGEPYDPRRPTVCFDETSTQLIARALAYLFQYSIGDGESGLTMSTDATVTRNLFMLCESPAGLEACGGHRATEDGGLCLTRCGGWWTRPTPRRRGFGSCMDNLNTHRPASLYQTFAPVEARRILKRL